MAADATEPMSFTDGEYMRNGAEADSPMWILPVSSKRTPSHLSAPTLCSTDARGSAFLGESYA